MESVLWFLLAIAFFLVAIKALSSENDLSLIPLMIYLLVASFHFAEVLITTIKFLGVQNGF